MEACKGFGTDDDALTDILCNRSKEQIARINEVYKKLYETSLLEQVKDECSGDYKRFLVQMISDQATADADSLFKAMDGMGTTERVLSEIIVTNTNAELLQIKKRYEEKYGQPLIDRVNSEVGGDFRTFLVTLLRCERNETAAPDARLAAEQAEALHKAAKGWGCDEKVFIEILAKSSVAQIDLIQATYERTHSKSLAALIKSEMSGDLEWAMLLNLESRLDASAWLLRYAMEGMGTSEDIIARVMGGASKQETRMIHAQFDMKCAGLCVAHHASCVLPLWWSWSRTSLGAPASLLADSSPHSCVFNWSRDAPELLSGTLHCAAIFVVLRMQIWKGRSPAAQKACCLPL